MTILEIEPRTWVAVCALTRLEPGRGAAARVDGRAVALFRLRGSEVVAIDDVDPCTGAAVLSRGLVGTTLIDGRAIRYVASPLRKHRFDLHSGACLDADAVVDVWPVRVTGGTVLVGHP